MSRLMNCGYCCLLLSIWGVIQLVYMGLLFFFEVPILFEEVQPEKYEDYDDFIDKTKKNYNKVAINCWIASGAYVVTLLISLICIGKAKKDAKRTAALMQTDDYICDPNMLEKFDWIAGDLKKEKKKKK